MEKYCYGCLHRGDDICELPGRIERFGRSVLLVVAPVLDGFAAIGTSFSGTDAPPDESGLPARTDPGIDSMNERVEACVRVHKHMEADGSL